MVLSSVHIFSLCNNYKGGDIGGDRDADTDKAESKDCGCFIDRCATGSCSHRQLSDRPHLQYFE